MYYIKIITFTPSDEVELNKNMHAKIIFNKQIRVTSTDYSTENEMNEIFLFEEEPKEISIFLMERKDIHDDSIVEGGFLGINSDDNLIELTKYCITLEHGLVGIEPFKDFKNKERDAEIDKNEVHYLKSVIDDKNNIIDELDKTTCFMKEKHEELREKIKDLENELEQVSKISDERDDLLIDMADKFTKIRKLLND